MKNRIRVVQMFYSYDVEAGGGGVTRFALDLGQKLDPAAFDVVYCSLGHHTTELGQQRLIRLKDQNLNAFEANPDWHQDRAYQRFFRAVANMRHEFSLHPVHILHSHSEYTDIAALLLKFQLYKPLILRTVHYGFHQEWRHRPLLRELLTNFAFPVFFNQEIGINQVITDRLSKRWIARLFKHQALCIHNAIDTERFRRNKVDKRAKKLSLGIPPDSPVVGSVGRLVTQKAYHYLVDAAPRILENFPDTIFLLVGDGDLENELRTRVHQLGLDQRFIFTGARKDVEELLSCMDVFVSTSLWEGLPTVILEAMACSIPVIASDIPGTNELVHHNANGWLTPPADSPALASAVITFLTDDTLGKRLALNARQTVDSFAMEAIAQKYQTLYTQLYRKKFPNARLGS